MNDLESQLLALEPRIRQKAPSGEGAELFQDVAVKCLQEARRNPLNWASEYGCKLIMRIARNCQIDQARRSKHRRHQSLSNQTPLPLADSRNALSLGEITESLSDEDRQLIHEHLVARKSLTEIASEHSCTASGIRARWYRLRAKLRKLENLR